MEWIKDYWYIILLGLFAYIFILNRRPNRGREGNRPNRDQEGNNSSRGREGKMDNHQNMAHAKGKTHKSGRGCCH